MAEAYDEAGNLLERNQFEYAIFLLSDVINTDYRKSEALYKRAVCYMKMNRYKEASEDLGAAITLDRTITSAYIKQAKCYLAIGDLNNAIVALTTLSQVDPDNSFAKCELQKMTALKEQDKKAKKLFEEKNYEEVIKIMDECLENAEICVRFKLMKAECLVYVGKHEDAFLIVNDVLFTHKDDLEAICIRAMNLLYQEKYNLGMTELREIIPISPRATHLFRMYKSIADKRKNADKALQKNNLDEAKILYHQILDIDINNIKQNKSIYIKLAEIFFKQKDYNNAIESCTQALEIETKNAKALKIRGDSNCEIKEYDLAIEDYNALIKIDNHHTHRQKLEQIQRKNKMEIDNYTILGVTRNTPMSEIKKAYHKLAIIYHPDKNSDKSKYFQHKCKVKFAKINAAYNELQSTSKKY